MHTTYTECLYRCADELSIPLFCLFPISCLHHHRKLTGRKFSVAAVGQDAVAKPMQEENLRRNQLGLTEEAFYEILANHPNAVQDFELIKELLKKILAEIKKSASQPDWYKKDDTKAQLQLAV
jgi:DNA polymerase III sliding clamp (beta) subunit (PCNA family)